MQISDILSFITALSEHNTREWFAANKAWYEQAKKGFEQISTEFIARLGLFDEEVQHMQAKDCMFRIYRDTRFSHDKTPYKTHFGVFVAANGGRKSKRCGYYLHLEPGNCFCASGIWCPPTPLLKALRQSIYDNIDEFLEIIKEKEFNTNFPQFWDFDKLKTAPQGFPKDWEHIEYLRLKHYMVEHRFTKQQATAENFLAMAVEKLELTLPLNRFLNYTADETDY